MKGNTVLLIIILVGLGASLYLSYNNLQQVNLLRHENTVLWEKLDSVQQIVNKKPVKQKAAPAATQSTGSPFLDFLIQMGEESEREAAAERAKQKVTVSSKYRLEDRYVSYRIKDPEYIGSQAGEVVLTISVDEYGKVKSAKLKSVTGITDEEVIEACKKAALQTDFNSNYDLNDNQSGTITYTFTVKK